MSGSGVWRFYTRNGDKAECKVCDKTLSCKGGTTSPLINHLKSHEKEFKEFESRKRKSSTSSGPTPMKQQKLDSMFPMNTEATQKLLDEAIVNFLAESGSAFRVVDLNSFKDMFRVTNDKIEVRSRKYYSNLVTMKANEMREELLGMIIYLKNKIQTVSFTTDMWTSVNGDPFICLTMHFITEDWSLTDSLHL